MGLFREFHELLVQIEDNTSRAADNTERTADAVQDIYTVLEQEQRDAIRNDHRNR